MACGSIPADYQAKIEGIAEKLRQEKYHLLLNNCLIKSIRFARECKRLEIDAKVVFSLSLASARLRSSGEAVNVPVLHAWARINGERIEVSRPLGYQGRLGITPEKVRPLVKLRL